MCVNAGADMSQAPICSPPGILLGVQPEYHTDEKTISAANTRRVDEKCFNICRCFMAAAVTVMEEMSVFATLCLSLFLFIDLCLCLGNQ